MGKRLRTSRKLKAKETASEPSRKGRLSLGWSGKGCCEKKFTFQSGGVGRVGGERRADKGSQHLSALSSSKGGHPLIQPLR